MGNKSIIAGAHVSEARDVIRRQFCGNAPTQGDVEALWRAVLSLIDYAREVEHVVAKAEGRRAR